MSTHTFFIHTMNHIASPRPAVDIHSCPRCGERHHPPLSPEEVAGGLGYVCPTCIEARERGERESHQAHSQEGRERAIKAAARGLWPSDPEHPTFAAILGAVRAKQANPKRLAGGWYVEGPAGLGKTRLGLWLCAQAAQRGQTFGVLWGDLLKDVGERDPYRWAKPDVLLIDDPFQFAARTEDVTLALRTILDLRRDKLTFVATQITGAQWLESAKKSSWCGPTHEANIEAVRRRIGGHMEPLRWSEPTGARKGEWV